MRHPLRFAIKAECHKSKARHSVMTLPHAEVETPVFMPVGTQGTMKGILPEQLEALHCNLILGNTYHLGNRPGVDILKKGNGLHNWMHWNKALLTDSGGFQIVSLTQLCELTEDGVSFTSPYDGKQTLLTPEKSIEIQNAIGADIMMQLDDVVHVLHPDKDRVEEAMYSFTDPVTEASIISDIKDRSRESGPGDESDGEQDATYNALPPSLSYANDAMAIVRKFLLSRGEVPVDSF
ncbi:unnamed protein product [Darwinula stevensoni]|uniref:tRNA-guanine(15) transglycosylase-like domain-containing protein n=1 Tax=Darwinula stevensoni TaxID=69355 RepID=A0A7R9AER2_9CRUS|nr:unnamed protein product [Darwinula stevensoni]CAG0902322.1 unnamed protein product [Darwinula stevensoni]